MNTNRHKPGYQRWMREIKVDMPTSDTGHIISLLVDMLTELQSARQRYHRLGVFLYDLVPASSLQTDLIGLVDPDQHDASQSRMAAMDAVNPRYVSSWAELPKARIMGLQ